MQFKAIDGSYHEIGMDELKRVYQEAGKLFGPHAAPGGAQHQFTIGGKQTALTVAEMKEIADTWWEHYGHKSMKTFFEEYQQKAAENIRKALGHHTVPACEKEVKAAIAQAVFDGNVDLIAEVIFESMEWETAYSALESIKE